MYKLFIIAILWVCAGTVGCVVMYKGHVAAGTSTGGMANKLPGRVGDTPIIGAGNYANDRTCAISATGTGEEFMRRLGSLSLLLSVPLYISLSTLLVVAHDISAQLEYTNRSISEAVRQTIKKLPEDCGGVIVVNTAGDVVVDFNSIGMFRGVAISKEHEPIKATVSIWDEEIKIDV